MGGAFGVGWALFPTDSGGLGAGPPTAGGEPDFFLPSNISGGIRTMRKFAKGI